MCLETPENHQYNILVKEAHLRSLLGLNSFIVGTPPLAPRVPNIDYLTDVLDA